MKVFVATLPTIVSNIKTATIGEIMIAVMVILGMTQGICPVIGVRESIPKIIIETCILSMFVYVLLQQIRVRQPLKGQIFAVPIVLAILSGLTSGFLHSSSILESVFYVRLLVMPLLFLIVVLNIICKKLVAKRFLMLIGLLMVFQIPFFIYKLIFIGVEEKHWIGALSQTAGQLGLIFPLLVLSILLPLYFAGSGWYILLIFIYSFLPVISEKRAVLVMLPVLFAGAALSYGWFVRKSLPCQVIALKPMFTKRIALILVCFAVWGGAAKMIPSLQSQGEMSYITQVLTYGKDYLMRDWSSPMNSSRLSKFQNTNIQLGRIALIKESIQYLASRGSATFLFGLGAGAINPSPNLGSDRADLMFEEYGIRGTYSFGLMLLWEGGLTAVIAAALFFLLLIREIVRHIERHYNIDNFLLGNGVLLMLGVLTFDFFVYSTTSWLTHTVTPVVFTLIAIFLRSGYAEYSS